MTRRLNRRQLLASTGAAAAYTVLGSVHRAAAAPPTATMIETKVISHQPQYYHGWSTLARRNSGELLLVYSGGRENHVCPFGRVELMRSHDDGKTWGWPSVVLDTEIDDRDAGVLETAKGSLLATTFTSLYYQSDLEAKNVPAASLPRWLAAHNRLNESQRKALLGSWMLRSTNGGLTWSQPYDSIVNSPHGPIQLLDGRLLHAGQKIAGDCIGICESTDDGQTWRWMAEIPTRSGDNPRQYYELHAVEAADHGIVVQIRNENANSLRETLQSESSDGGKTWTTPHSIGVWGHPSHLLRLKDGRLLMTYGYRQSPIGNQARTSQDHGRTWSQAITISADGANIDLGYPSTMQLADGLLLTVWYERLASSGFAVLRQSHWTLSGI